MARNAVVITLYRSSGTLAFACNARFICITCVYSALIVGTAIRTARHGIDAASVAANHALIRAAFDAVIHTAKRELFTERAVFAEIAATLIRGLTVAVEKRIAVMTFEWLA